MKKLMVLMVLTGMILSSCAIDGDINSKMKSPNYPQNSTLIGNTEETGNKAEKSQIESEKIFENFMKLVIRSAKPVELITYIDSQIGKVSQERADEMIMALEEVQDIFNEYYNGKLSNIDFHENGVHDAVVFKGKGGNDIIEMVKDEALKSLLTEVYNGGYKLIGSEGTIYAIINYSFLKKYNGHVSPKVSGFIDVMAITSEKIAASDAALTISWDELAQRIIKFEGYIKENEEFKKTNELKNIYYRYIRWYLAGLDNTPAYDRDTRVYKNDVLKSFNNFTSNNQGSKSAQIVNEYLNIIKKDNNIFSEEAHIYVYKLYEESVNSEAELSYQYINNVLSVLLPERTGYRWVYNGTAEYGHQMTLDGIENDDDRMTYIIKGKVADMSDGESGKSEDYFEIDMKYLIKNATIRQDKSEKMMMDSKIDSIELIRAPLVKGNKWTQIVFDGSGNDRFFECEITDINEVGGSKVYTVEYKDMESEYYETRMIQEGVGVVSFNKLFQSGDEDFEVGYSLYKDVSGY
jgi:hypothetical protein